MTVIEEIAAERQRQIDVEGWTAEHDDKEHGRDDLSLAAAAYAVPAYWRWNGLFARKLLWPWDAWWLKPTSRRRDLIKAGALIVAEIERLDRATPSSTGQEGK